MRIIVGYTADRRGAEAIALAASVGGSGAGNGASPHLDIVMVLPQDTPFSAVYPGSDHGYKSIIAERIDTWAAEALTLVPAGSSARVLVRSADSEAAGMIAVAKETGADLIVVGGQHGRMAGMLGLGSVASSLLHSSPFPVALAPDGFGEEGIPVLSRVTAFIGARPGTKGVVETAAQAATAQGVPLRVVSLMAIDFADEGETIDESLTEAIEAKISTIVAAAGARGEIEVASGKKIEDAVQGLEWIPGEIAVVGSSRLARKHRLFLGSTAQRMLRTLPVPMLVVPRSYRRSQQDR